MRSRRKLLELVGCYQPANSRGALPLPPAGGSPKLLYEKCSTERWGEVYTSGGLLCDTDWRGYCEASREDVYAIATAITWKGNVSYGNSSNLVRVYYEYDNVFYNTTHIKNKALELYQKAYDETFTILYGVWPSLQYVEYNWRNDYSWTNPANNPFA